MLLNKRSSQISIGGISTAISVLCLLLTSVFPFWKLAFSFVSSVIVGVLIIAYGYKIGLIHYVAVSLLALFLVPNKTIAIFYAVVVGNYPAVKFLLDRLKNNWLKLFLKLILYNVYMIICYTLAVTILNIDMSLGYPVWILWILMIVAFCFYDFIYMPFVTRVYSLLNKR